MSSACIICKSLNTKEVLSLTSSKINIAKFKELSDKKFNGFLEKITPDKSKVKVRKCNKCGHHWYPWHPMEKELIEMYDKKVVNIYKTKNSSESNINKYIFKELSLIKRHFKKVNRPNFLDYGSGYGKWTSKALELGFNVIAYEPSDTRSNSSKNQSINFIKSLDDLKNINIDIINLEQVLEHIPNPSKVLNELSNICTSNTLLRIRVPNILRPKEGKNIYLDWPFSNNTSHTLMPFEHINGFTPKSLFYLSRSCSLKINNKFTLMNRPKIFMRYLLMDIIPTLGSTSLYLKIKK